MRVDADADLRTVLRQAFPELEGIVAEYDAADLIDGPDHANGPYILYPNTVGTMVQVVLAMDPSVGGRTALLERLVAFTEDLLASPHPLADDVVADAVGYWLSTTYGGLEAMERFGGPHLRAWYEKFGARRSVSAAEAPQYDEDNVRLAMLPALDVDSVADLPGVSAPVRLPSLEEARRTPDGAVMFARSGVTMPFVVARATDVRVDEPTLRRIVDAVLRRMVPRAPRSWWSGAGPDVTFLEIPYGERVPQMRRGVDLAARLHDELWVEARLGLQRRWVRELLAGTRSLRS